MTATRGGTSEFVVVCEATADQQSACTLADRVLVERGIASDRTTLDARRTWRGIEGDELFVPWKHVRARFEEEGLRTHGHFEGQPGAPDAHAARRALLLIHRRAPNTRAVLLIRDSDNDLQRVEGLKQARAAFRGPFTVVIGVAHTKRECWIIAVFDARDERGRKTLAQLTRDLAFDPCTGSHD